MKKVIIGAVAVIIIAGTVVFASSTPKKEQKCDDPTKCCKVTPNCQPGDPNCVCPIMCDDEK